MNIKENKLVDRIVSGALVCSVMGIQAILAQPVSAQYTPAYLECKKNNRVRVVNMYYKGNWRAYDALANASRKEAFENAFERSCRYLN